MRTVEDILQDEGVRAYMITTNGPRLYVERAPGVSFLGPKRGHQAAYIDLTDMSVHCRTFGRGLNAKQCKRESDRVERELAPLARRLEAMHIEPRGPSTRFCQSAYLAQLFASAGVDCSRLATMLILDAPAVGSAVGIAPDHARGYRVQVVPVEGNELWNAAFLTQDDLVGQLGINPMRGCELQVHPIIRADPHPIIRADPFDLRLLKWGALHIAKVARAYHGPIPRTANDLKP